jgi:Immunity protein 52
LSALVLLAWWQSRLETPDECALRLAEMLRRLAVVHPIFGRWRRQAGSKGAAQRPFCSMPPDIRELGEIIAKTGQRHVTGRAVPELGYRFSAWNELDRDHGLSFSCCPGRSDAKLFDVNSIEFSFGNPTPKNSDLLSYSVLNEVLTAVAQSWDVGWGTIEPWANDLRFRDAKGDLLRPWPGWLTYLSPAFVNKITPPSGVTVQRLSNGGVLMAVTKDQFDPSNPSQVAIYNAIQDSLRPLQT